MRSPVPSLAAWMLLLLAACASGAQPAPADGCAALFGSPNAQTGLSSAQCTGSCTCGGPVFTPPTYDAAFVGRLVTDWTIETPYAALTSDPYLRTPPAEDPSGRVCAVVPVGPAASLPRTYRLEEFDSETLARDAGAKPTHFGHCGVCSTLGNLAVYMRENDLTAPVRACGMSGLGYATLEEDVACLQALGFDLPCAQVWAYNTQHTRERCLQVCITALSQSYNQPDGSLNECLRCDERESGPVFKWIAGRTRRNCGLPNAICRPCSEVRPLVHAY